MTLTHALARNETTNARLVWVSAAVLGLAAVVSGLSNRLPWGVFALVVVGFLTLPAVVTRDGRATVPWPLASFVTVPVVVRATGRYPELAGYVAISGLALVAVVEIEAFTAVQMSRRVAVFVAVLTTMAFQSWWLVGQYYADRWLGTNLIPSQTELQWDLVVVTIVSVLMGGIFLWYFDRIEHVGAADHTVVPEEES